MQFLMGVDTVRLAGIFQGMGEECRLVVVDAAPDEGRGVDEATGLLLLPGFFRQIVAVGGDGIADHGQLVRQEVGGVVSTGFHVQINQAVLGRGLFQETGDGEKLGKPIATLV